MTTAAIQGNSGWPATGQHPLDRLIPDPCAIPPMCDEDEFAALAQSLVAEEAPRLFAIMQVYGDRVDGRIAAWGMAFADHTEVVSATSGARMILQAPETAIRAFTIGSHVHARLIWVSPAAATPTEDASQPEWQIDARTASICHYGPPDGQ